MNDIANRNRAISHMETASQAEASMPTEQYALTAAQVYALLDIADAIREHTATTRPQTYTLQKDHS